MRDYDPRSKRRGNLGLKRKWAAVRLSMLGPAAGGDSAVSFVDGVHLYWDQDGSGEEEYTFGAYSLPAEEARAVLALTEAERLAQRLNALEAQAAGAGRKLLAAGKVFADLDLRHLAEKSEV